MTAMTKHELRKLLRSRHAGADARNRESILLCQHILANEEYKQAQVIGGYMPLLREADVTPVLEDALRQGKVLALPLCERPPQMTLRKVTSLAELTPGAYGIPEPQPNAPVIPVTEIDLLLVPLEGIDDRGYRLGKGGGYYDHLLAQGQPFTLGCALSWQWVDAVPRDHWDKGLHACADHRGIHTFIDGREENHHGQEEAED